MTTKENIMNVALKQFANRGYEAVSISDIAGELGLSKGALYKHYKSKRDILDSIIERIQVEDRNRALDFQIPEEVYEGNPEAYEVITLKDLIEYSKGEFRYWTQDEFAAAFRRMLTVSQYSDPELEALYRKYILHDVLDYIRDGFAVMKLSDKENNKKARYLAIEFHSVYYTLLNLYDTAEDKDEIYALMDMHMQDFYERYK